MHDLAEFCQQHRNEGLLLMIDFSKAFDTLEWEFLFKTLKEMNFGESFLTWVKILYTDIESCVINNGCTSKYFKVRRGVRQGDPLSALLFILAMEVLTVSVNHNKAISGLTIKDTELKLVQYADDLTAILKDQCSLDSLLQEMKTFSKISGLKLNYSKTSALTLGIQRPFKLPQGIKWATEPKKLLGCYIGTNLIQCHKLSIQEKISNIKQILSTWQHRNLSLTGKILIVKSLAISQIIHLANLVPFPDESVKQLEEILFNFIYDGKTHKVKKAIIIQDFKHGGQKNDRY